MTFPAGTSALLMVTDAPPLADPTIEPFLASFTPETETEPLPVDPAFSLTVATVKDLVGEVMPTNSPPFDGDFPGSQVAPPALTPRTDKFPPTENLPCTASNSSPLATIDIEKVSPSVLVPPPEA